MSIIIGRAGRMPPGVGEQLCWMFGVDQPPGTSTRPPGQAAIAELPLVGPDPLVAWLRLAAGVGLPSARSTSEPVIAILRTTVGDMPVLQHTIKRHRGSLTPGKLHRQPAFRDVLGARRPSAAPHRLQRGCGCANTRPQAIVMR